MKKTRKTADNRIIPLEIFGKICYNGRNLKGRKNAMLSMTGYGKGEYKDGGIELTCEIKTVNNRYLDVSVKAPRIFAAYEDMVRSLVRAKLTRGHADVFVSCKDKREKPAALTADVGLAASYVAAAQALKEAFPSLADDVTLSSVLRYPDVLKQDDAAAADESTGRRTWE